MVTPSQPPKLSLILVNAAIRLLSPYSPSSRISVAALNRRVLVRETAFTFEKSRSRQPRASCHTALARTACLVLRS